MGAALRRGGRRAGPPGRRRHVRQAARRDAPGRRAPRPARRAHIRLPRRAPGRRDALHHRALRPRRRRAARRRAVHAARPGRVRQRRRRWGRRGHGGDRVLRPLPSAHRAEAVRQGAGGHPSQQMIELLAI